MLNNKMAKSCELDQWFFFLYHVLSINTVWQSEWIDILHFL